MFSAGILSDLKDACGMGGCNLITVNQSPCDNFRLQPGDSEPTAVVTANSHSRPHSGSKILYTTKLSLQS
ncbi:hypothetical protein ACOMHN_053673 [Nucella lapillus]